MLEIIRAPFNSVRNGSSLQGTVRPVSIWKILVWATGAQFNDFLAESKDLGVQEGADQVARNGSICISHARNGAQGQGCKAELTPRCSSTYNQTDLRSSKSVSPAKAGVCQGCANVFGVRSRQAERDGGAGQTGNFPFSEKSPIVTSKTNLVKQISEKLPSVPIPVPNSPGARSALQSQLTGLINTAAFRGRLTR